MMTNALIPVADAFPAVAGSRGAPRAGATVAVAYRDDVSAEPGSRAIYGVMLVWTLIHFTQFGFIDGKEPWNIVLVIMRYFLWPSIFLMAFFHVAKHGYAGIAQCLRYFVPMVAIGMVSSLLGFSPFNSYRLMFFWMLGVLIAATIGFEVRRDTLRSILFWTFSIFVVASLIVVFAAPKYGVMTDTRVEGNGAWRGLFPGKNFTGLICVYTLLMAWFAPRPARWVRLAFAGVAIAFLVFSNSQGAVAVAGLTVEYLFLVGVLRRSKLSPGAQAAVLGLVTVLTMVTLLIGATFLLQFLGRDTTFSGRTDIWAAFLTRASYFWLLGAGPGSFSLPFSPLVQDLAVIFQKYGDIHTPHNMFIAAFGEIGIFGFFAFTIPLFYFAFVLPMVNRQPGALMVATIAFTMLVGGIAETREVFGVGMNMFLLILSLASMKRSEAWQGSEQDEAEPDGAERPARQPLFGDDLYAPRNGPRVLG